MFLFFSIHPCAHYIRSINPLLFHNTHPCYYSPIYIIVHPFHCLYPNISSGVLSLLYHIHHKCASATKPTPVIKSQSISLCLLNFFCCHATLSPYTFPLTNTDFYIVPITCHYHHFTCDSISIYVIPDNLHHMPQV